MPDLTCRVFAWRPKKTGDDYILNGTKTWISNGIKGNCLAVLTKTDPSASPPHRGMSLFVCEKGDGFSVGKKLKKLGYRSIDSAELIFEDFRVRQTTWWAARKAKDFSKWPAAWSWAVSISLRAVPAWLKARPNGLALCHGAQNLW